MRHGKRSQRDSRSPSRSRHRNSRRRSFSRESRRSPQGRRSRSWRSSRRSRSRNDSRSRGGRSDSRRPQRSRRRHGRSKKGPNCQAFVPPMPGGMPFPMFPFPPLWPWPMPNTGAEPSGRRSPRRRRRSSSSRAEGNCKDSVLVRRNLMGRVIGRGGGVINTIRQDSGARIDAEDRDEDHCEFRITGTEEQVRRAKTMIREQADRVRCRAAT
ncbi:Tudor and KH domain-containing protein [Durusdinium trenchii]|uniref:Tudor and KH domain-containing protein n=1 Tax=Durusdinium trenchii TaxID=1381693 RepID=A0ABP0L4P6_9DINO